MSRSECGDGRGTAIPATEQQWRETMAAGSRSAQRGDLAGALQAFDAAVKLSPERVEGWINLGSMMVECRQLKAAINVLGQAIQRQPDNWVSYMVMGDAQRLNADRDKALECYRKAVAIARAPAALNRLGSFLRHMGQVDEAVTHFDEAIATDERFSLAQVNRATIEIDRGNFDEA
ncbi:MAG: tetratricopeptide repeat protein, partial [Halioglobus sp.]|nr:tetratricopeptide repeat protein [Halioglobus sp.]